MFLYPSRRPHPIRNCQLILPLVAFWELNKIFKNFLFPLQYKSTAKKWLYSLLPTFLALFGWSYAPEFLRQLPAFVFYPVLFLSTWLGGVWSGFITTVCCVIYSVIFLRPILVLNTSMEIPTLVRLSVFLFTSILFLGLVGALQKTLKKANTAIALRDEFLSLAGHELKTPITALNLQLEMVRTILKDDGQQNYNTLLDPSVRQLKRLEKLITSMMDTSLLDSGHLALKKTECDLEKIIHEAIANLKIQNGESNIQISIISTEGNYQGLWDELRIEQIISNIVHNAYKYSQGKPIEIHLGNNKDLVWFSVHDQGKGIPEEDHEKIFERFHRLNSGHDIQGLGLGLYLTKRFVELHDGKIILESSPGQGSKFRVQLPV